MLSLKSPAAFLLAFCLSSTAYAGDIYKWQDEDGIWHFSSMPPATDEDFATIEMPVEPKQTVTMRKLGTAREPEYVFFNNTWGPVELALKLTQEENVVSEPPLPVTLILPGQSEKRLLKIRAENPDEGFSYQLAYETMIGPPLLELPEEINYYPPFPSGVQYVISQGFDSGDTHNSPPNQYAVDIVMPIGTPILAARAGQVIDLEDNFHGAGKQDRYLARSNQIRILHSDGTMAVYAHLQPNRARVRPGTMVKTGQWIGSSGNTGYSNGPHLHFVIQINTGMSLESVPFKFYTLDKSTVLPDQQMMIDGVLPIK